MSTPQIGAGILRVAQTAFSGSVVSASLLVGASLQAAPPRTAEPAKPAVVARSSQETAATGRRPISSRLASARKPISIPQPAPETAATAPLAAAADDMPRPTALAELAALAGDATAEAVVAPETGLADAATTEPAMQPTLPEPAIQPTLEAAPVAPVRVGGLLYPPSVVSDSGANEPARLPAADIRLQVTESHPQAVRGGAIEWRLELCNTGSEPAANVTAVLFFAEGIEPVAASGAAASLAAGEVRFDPLQTLGPGEIVELQVTGVGTGAGEVPYRAEVVSSSQQDPIAQDGSIQVRSTP